MDAKCLARIRNMHAEQAKPKRCTAHLPFVFRRLASSGCRCRQQQPRSMLSAVLPIELCDRVQVPTAVAHARKMVSDGADIIDVGGQSTRPGAQLLTANEELQRVLPVIR